MKNIRIFFSEKFHFLLVKFSVYLKRRVLVMFCPVFQNEEQWFNDIGMNNEKREGLFAEQ